MVRGGVEKSEWHERDVYPARAGVEAVMAMPAEREDGLPPNLAELSDADLIGRAAEGDAGALEVLYDR